ncbi:hypothetical protein E2562_031292 [Oryza meyeriana var. granulata]|uniref:Uncharacterized protein n=1 Tax=Oryza meyeriana var. granulata TaxID=110450 RepID=A0A6G1CA68_9ORYZ|nr:hypothetical protein E2562_031292 [Oryza meyeriana var. granulata]
MDYFKELINRSIIQPVAVSSNTEYLGPKCLKEVILDERMGEETKEKWKETVKNHPRRPKILFVKTGEAGQMQNMEVAQPAENAAASAMVTGVQTPAQVVDIQRQLNKGSEVPATWPKPLGTLVAILPHALKETNGTSAAKLNCIPANGEHHHFC